jgi:glycosyltransferase involved in cell wall biosynthesis
MTTALRLSVIIATYNRAETIGETIRRLTNQDLDPEAFEVVVIDDGSNDDTSDVVAEWIVRAPFRLRYQCHTNRGPGYTQNRGLEAAVAPVILLMADDIFMTRSALSAHLALHDAHPEQEVAVLGRVVQSDELGQSVFLKRWEAFRFKDFVGLIELPYYRFWACNISAKRDFVLKWGPFREERGRAGAASHEDAELGYRLHKGGLRILYAPDALAYHYHVVSFEGACNRRRMQGLNFGQFYRNAPQPEIPVAYHVLTVHTLGDHLCAWFGPRTKYLSRSDRNPLIYLARDFARRAVFNWVTVPLFWRPLLEFADSSRLVGRLATSAMYRGVGFHYFMEGCREGKRRYDRA